MKTYAIGAKLGDFIHGLLVPSYIYQTTGEKALVYICEEGCSFTTGIQNTYNELFPIMKDQDFVEGFEIHKGQKVDYEVFRFRADPGLFRDSWPEIYFRMTGKPRVKDFSWMTCKNPVANDVVINRTVRQMSESTLDMYKNLVKESDVFVCSDIEQYKAFPLKTRLFHCITLYEMFQNIAGAGLFIGNQSAPLAMASALGVQRWAELRQSPDAPHYSQEDSSKLKFFIGD